MLAGWRTSGWGFVSISLACSPCFFGALTLGAILSWLSVGAGSSNARLLLFAMPQFVGYGICTWALFRGLTTSNG